MVSHLSRADKQRTTTGRARMTKRDTTTVNMDPRQYIIKRSRQTGEVIDTAFSPEDLLVHAHRDNHPADVTARAAMSQLVDLTGKEDWVKRVMKQTRKVGQASSETLATLLPFTDASAVASRMWGLEAQDYTYEFKDLGIEPLAFRSKVTTLQFQGATQLVALQRHHGLRILLTGGTGFLGQELITQLASQYGIDEVTVLIRPKTIRDRKTNEVLKVLSPAERGSKLLDDLGICQAEARERFRFLAGDIEEPMFGISDEALETLKQETTHVIHCAASVSFDATYEDSFRANVLGSKNALSFSKCLQDAEGSPFVAHLSIETSYIHGRQNEAIAREDTLTFPNNFYNNHYELTKAMASIETERFMLEEGLRVIQLCPSIVIGHSKSGKNYGDLKVVNAPVNAFGRAHQALTQSSANLEERVLSWAVAQVACIFPGDARAQLNLVPVDRVAEGILAALERPNAIGTRVHLATDKLITSQDMRDICAEELGVNVRLAEPTLHRNLTLPVVTKILELSNQEKLGRALNKLGTIFGGYSEWGQPVHEVGNDATILGLNEDRPDTEAAFRMLCRHNRYVQDFGQVRDATEIARRERLWDELIVRIELDTGWTAATLSPQNFEAALSRYLDLEHFILRPQHQTNTKLAA